jgi:hypothetical protein
LSSIDIDGGTIDGTVIGGSTPAAGSFTTGSFTGDVAHGDGVKATFGSSADLQVFHTGSTSYILEQGTGDLRIRGNEVRIEDGDGSTIALFQNNAGAQLRHNGTTVLDTNATGINVSGTVVAEGLTVDAGSGTNVKSTGNNLQFDRDAGASFIDQIGTGSIRLRTTSSFTNRMDVANNGDISFYEDTGTTAKFFWDASAESLGIGTIFPADRLHVEGNIYLGASSRTIYTGASADLTFQTNTGNLLFLRGNGASESMRIDSSGNVGIGTSSPSASLDVRNGSAGSTVASFKNASGFGLKITPQIGGSGSVTEIGLAGGESLSFAPNNSEAMRITSTGNLEMTGGGSVGWANWTITESGGSLYFATGGTNKMKLDASGNLDVVGSVNSNATIT